MRDKIEAALEKIRPGLRLDGGDVQLLDVTNDGVVRVALVGSCAGCQLSRMLLKKEIELALGSLSEVKTVVTEDQRIKR